MKTETKLGVGLAIVGLLLLAVSSTAQANGLAVSLVVGGVCLVWWSNG